MTSAKISQELTANQAVQTAINASDCAVGMLNSLASLLAGIQAMAYDNGDIRQLAMLGQEIVDGYMETMRSYKENLPALADGGAK
jgi:hypothetical protein